MTEHQAPWPDGEVLAGIVERVTFHNAESGFAVLRVKARGHRDLVTIVGHAATIAAGEWITATGEWVENQGLEKPCLNQLQPEFLEGFQRQEEAALYAGKSPEAITLVERHRTIVLGIHDDGVDHERRARPDDTANGVKQQSFTEALALACAIDSEPSQDRGRHGVMREPLRQGRRQFFLLEAGGAQAVIAGNLPWRIAESDEHLGHAPPDILRRLPLKVGIESRFSAGESRTVMARAERLDNQGRFIHRHAHDTGARLPSASRSVPAG